MSIGSPCPVYSLKEAISPGSRPKLGEKQQDDKRSSSFDILSKWYIDGELEHRHNLHAHEKSELIKEIESLGQKNYSLRLEKKENETRLHVESGAFVSDGCLFSDGVLFGPGRGSHVVCYPTAPSFLKVRDEGGVRGRTSYAP